MQPSYMPTFESLRAQHIQKLPTHIALSWKDLLDTLECQVVNFSARRRNMPSPEADKLIRAMANGELPVDLLAIADPERAQYKIIPIRHHAKHIPAIHMHTLAYPWAHSVTGLIADISKDPPDGEYPAHCWTLVHPREVPFRPHEEHPMLVVRPIRTLPFSDAIRTMVVLASSEMTELAIRA